MPKTIKEGERIEEREVVYNRFVAQYDKYLKEQGFVDDPIWTDNKEFPNVIGWVRHPRGRRKQRVRLTKEGREGDFLTIEVQDETTGNVMSILLADGIINIDPPYEYSSGHSRQLDFKHSPMSFLQLNTLSPAKMLELLNGYLTRELVLQFLQDLTEEVNALE